MLTSRPLVIQILIYSILFSLRGVMYVPSSPLAEEEPSICGFDPPKPASYPLVESNAAAAAATFGFTTGSVTLSTKGSSAGGASSVASTGGSTPPRGGVKSSQAPSTANETAVPANDRRPNFIFFLADDLGYGEVSLYREGFEDLNHNITTPHIDALLRSGLRFSAMYAAPECAVSRGALMTGKDLTHATIRKNGGPALGSSDTTFLESLQTVGYRTSCVGKWHMSGTMPYRSSPEGAPWNKGCERFYGAENVGWYYPSDHVFRFTPESGLQELTFPANRGASRQRCMTRGHSCVWLTDLTTDAAVAELDYHAARQAAETVAGAELTPFFMYLAWSEPHTGTWASNGSRESGGRGNPVPSNGRFGAETAWPTVEQDHAAAIAIHHDAAVERVMDHLRALGLRKSTAVVYVSDNGAVHENAAHGGHNGAFFSSSGPLQGWKLWLTDGGIRVPFGVSWPGRIAAGAVCDTPVAFWDLAPTMLEMARVPATAWPSGMNGVSLLQKVWLQQPSPDTGKVVPAADFVHPPLLFERCSNGRDNRPAWTRSRKGGGFGRAVRDGRWKLLGLFAAGEFSEFRLFDMAVDIGETTDVSVLHPEIAARLREMLTAPAARAEIAGGYVYPASDICGPGYGSPLPPGMAAGARLTQTELF